MTTTSERRPEPLTSPAVWRRYRRMLVRPPQVRSRTQERGSTALELFFDLAFVVLFRALATRVGADLTLSGWADLGVTFVAVWWVWGSFTLYANRFDTDDVVLRLAKLGAMLAVVVCSVQLPGIDGVPTSFVVGYLATQLLLIGLYVRTSRHVEQARGLSRLYLTGFAVSAACWAATLLLAPEDRLLLAVAGLLAAMVAPVVRYRLGRSVPLHLEHLPERFGLLVILVLGETIIGVGHGLAEVHWTVLATIVAVAGFLLAVGLWWLYFDLGARVAKSGLTDIEESSRGGDAQESELTTSGRFDGYVFGHIPATLGIIAVGVGVDHAVVEASQPTLPLATLLPLCGGAALFVLSLALIQATTTGLAEAGWAWPASGALLLVAVLVLGLVAAPAVVTALAVAVVAGTVVVGGLKVARGDLDTEDADVM